MEEIPVSAESSLDNVMLKDSGIRQKYNLIIIAIKKQDDRMLFNPSFEARIKSGDTVIAVGEPINLKKLEKEVEPLIHPHDSWGRTRDTACIVPSESCEIVISSEIAF